MYNGFGELCNLCAMFRTWIHLTYRKCILWLRTTREFISWASYFSIQILLHIRFLRVCLLQLLCFVMFGFTCNEISSLVVSWTCFDCQQNSPVNFSLLFVAIESIQKMLLNNIDSPRFRLGIIINHNFGR